MPTLHRPTPASLETIRAKLQGLEDTIIRALLERLQYPANANAYTPGYLEIATCTGPRPMPTSYFLWMLRETEAVHAKAGRFDAFDERPFFPDHPPSVVRRGYAAWPIYRVDVNFNDVLMSKYLQALSDMSSANGASHSDDATLGDAIVRDIQVLQAISQRIHYGQLVMESKAQADEAWYADAVKRGDTAAIMEKLTNRAVEAAILDRVEAKANAAGIDGVAVRRFYETVLIPMTKDVEVDYMMKRTALIDRENAASSSE